jgi:hypothetical protein
VEATGNKFKATREFWVRPCDELIDKLASQVGTENIKICGGNK